MQWSMRARSVLRACLHELVTECFKCSAPSSSFLSPSPPLARWREREGKRRHTTSEKAKERKRSGISEVDKEDLKRRTQDQFIPFRE